MSSQPHPQLLHGRNLSVASDQQKILDRQTVSKAPGQPHQDVPSAVQDSIKAHYLRREERRKRDAHEATLENQALISKLKKQKQEHGVGPLSPIQNTTPSTPMAPAPAPVPSPSQGTAVSWSPSPDRSKQTGNSTPTRPPAPAFPSSVPEEPLDVQLPEAHTENLPITAQSSTPFLRRDARSIEPPPCGQPSQSATGTPAPGERRINPFKPHELSWSAVDSASQREKASRPPMEYTLSKRASPYRSSLPSPSNKTSIVPPPGQTFPDPRRAPLYRSSLPSSSNNTSNVPPPGQTVPHPGWPAPYQHSPLKGSQVAAPSSVSEDIVASAEEPTGAALQLILSGSQMPMAQTMSYVSPDMASQPPAQQAERFQSSTGSAQEVPFNGTSTQSQDSQPVALQGHDLMDGVRSAVLSRVRNGRSSDEQERAHRPTEQQEAGHAGIRYREDHPAVELPDVADLITGGLPEYKQQTSEAAVMTERGPCVEEKLIPDSAHGQSTKAEAAGNSQEASTLSAVSAISATQQPVKLSISFDDHASPFDTFCKVYKEYNGDLEAFVKACMCLEHMWTVKALHSSLWDDFVGHFPLFQARHIKGKRERLYASEWYNDRDEEAVFTEKLINKTNLAGILSYHDSMVQKFMKRIHHSPQKPVKQQLDSDAKDKQTEVNGEGSSRDHRAPSPSRVVIIDSQSDDGGATHVRNSPEEMSTEMASEKRRTNGKPTESRAKLSSASNDIVASTPETNDNPPISENQRIAQEALLMDTRTANRLPTPAAPQHTGPGTAPSSSKPSSTMSRAKGPMNAAQRKALMSFVPSKGKGKNNKGGAKGAERRTSSLTRSDAS